MTAELSVQRIHETDEFRVIYSDGTIVLVLDLQLPDMLQFMAECREAIDGRGSSDKAQER